MENYNFTHLEKNISDMIFEGMVKIGYMEGKSVSVFYDPGLVCYLLDTGEMEETSLQNCMVEFAEFVKPHFHDLKVKFEAGRYEFAVPKEGVKYIYENNTSREFLKKLVQVLQGPACGLEEIIDVFREVSEHITVEEIQHSEFQYVITFQDKHIDEFHYCFTFDEMGHYYHRLLDYDFEKVVHCDC